MTAEVVTINLRRSLNMTYTASAKKQNKLSYYLMARVVYLAMSYVQASISRPIETYS